MDKENIKKELNALMIEGQDIYFAALIEYDKDYFKKHTEENSREVIENAVEDARKKIARPKRHYYSWYYKASRVIRIFAPERLAKFEELYTGSKHVKKTDDLDIVNAGIAHYLQGYIITQDDEKIDFFDTFDTSFKTQRYILLAICQNFDNPLFNLESEIQYEFSKSELDIAKELQKNKHLREAGMIAGLVIELHLKNVAKNRNIKLPKNPQMKHYNEKLKNEIDDATITKQIELCSIIRNKCAHAGGALPTDDEVNTIISIAEKIIATVN